MPPLVAATYSVPHGVAAAIDAGRHHRIDYHEVHKAFSWRFVDYDVVGGGGLLAWLERKSRLDLRFARKVAQVVRSGAHEVVLSLSERVGLPLARLLPRDVAQVVVVHHALSAAKLRAMQIAGARDRWTRWIAISAAEADALRARLALPPEQVVSLVTPVDTAFYKPRPVPLDEQRHILSLGSSHRDFQTLVHAMRSLRHIACSLRVGSLWVHSDAARSLRHVPANVEIGGFTAPDGLREVYARSRFVVVPLLGNTQWSAGCTTVQQAQAMGKAVIASDRPGLSSYLIHGKTGLLVRTGDAKDLAEAIDYLWAHPEVADEMGRQGRALVECEQSMEWWLEQMGRIVGDLGTDTRG